jgi:hypothetical protein
MIDSNTTALQNLVVAYNNSTKATASVAGQTTSITYIGAAESSVNSGPCRLVNVCVVEGSGMVKFYNSQSGNALPADSLLFVLTSAAPIGVTPVGLNFNLGLYIVVEAGVSINCTYSIA